MSEWIQCPNCGTVMTVTTSGYLCPMCGTALPVKILHMTSGTSAECVRVRHGKWIPIKRGENGYSAGDFRCSICKKANPCRHLTAYCPNCGARMDEERKEE